MYCKHISYEYASVLTVAVHVTLVHEVSVVRAIM